MDSFLLNEADPVGWKSQDLDGLLGRADAGRLALARQFS